MSERKKKLAYFAAFVIAVILLILFLRKNPQVIKAIEAALGPIPIQQWEIPGPVNDTPHDYELPPIMVGDLSINSACNFCTPMRIKVIPPSMPVPAVAPAKVAAAAIQPMPFGGSGSNVTFTGVQVGNWFVAPTRLW